MLTQLSITGFRCFQEVNVPLKPLTVLIGPNDTGKSTFLRAIELLGGAGPSLEDIRRQSHGMAMKISGVANTDRFEIVAEQKGSQLSAKRGKPLEQVCRFQLPNSGVATHCKGLSENETQALALKSDGGNVAAILDHFLRSDRKRFFAIVEAMKNAVPGLEDIDIATPDAAKRRIDLVIDNGCKIPAAESSAGVRLLLFFITLLHHPKPPRIVLIEEPENGIHPKRLREIMAILRDVTIGRHGTPAQIIVTTHSPYLVDYVDSTKDELLVFQRAKDGSRTAIPVDWSRLKEFFDGFLLGEIWFNEEEAGLVAQEAS